LFVEKGIEMPRAFYGFGMIYVPESELGAIVKELHLRGKKKLRFEYYPNLEKFVFFNVDGISIAKDIREILREARLIRDPEFDSNRLDPVAGKL